jgi:LytS/YehU family sensor histidine kinase
VDDSQQITQIALYTLIPFAVSFSFIVFVFYRQNRENEIRKGLVELELKALRAQINPHFIFNCLNSIYFSIKEGDTEKAGAYLLKFSFLTRRILELSGKGWITLNEEIEMLRAYLELEQLRKENRFAYSFQIDTNLDLDNVKVPMLLIQPILENSIWHGFSNNTVDAALTVSITSEHNYLAFMVEDNGALSRSTTGDLDTIKKKSMGTSLVQEQLSAIELIEKKRCEMVTTHKVDSGENYCGRNVRVSIPLINFN